MGRPPCNKNENGFSLVEVLVAMTLLLVSVLGLMAMADSAASTTTQTRAREGAVSLAREVLEQAGGIPFAQVDPTTLASKLQESPGLADSAPAAGWSVLRRDGNGAGGFTYTLSASSCSIDDVADGYGARTGATFCAGAPAAGTDDSQPEDFKRVTVSVSWTQKGQTKTLSQTAMFAKNGSPDLPVMNSLSLTSPAVSSPQSPVIGTNATSAAFTSTATSTATSVVYSVDGVDIGNATKSGSNWVFSLNIASWTDGGYAIGARAVNAQGISGPTRTLTLTLARNAPAAPTGLLGGRNIITMNGSSTSVAEFDWLPNAERNVLGYRVYRPNGSLACPGNSSTLDLASSCVDFSPVTGTYTVRAVYRNASGSLLESAGTTVGVTALQGPYNSFFLKPTSAHSSSNCATASTHRDLDDGYTPGATESTVGLGGGATTVNLCTRSLAALDSIAAGTTRLHVWATNDGGGTCNLTATIGVNNLDTGYSATQAILGKTSTQTLVTYSLATSSHTFASGDKMNVRFSAPGGGCANTTLYFGSSARPSRLDLVNPGLDQPAGKPNPPTNLAGVANADGSRTLSWTAPALTHPVSFYRIYRDGREYTKRYDQTGDASTTYTDPNSDGGSHTYYVTAVSPALAESNTLGPITR